MKLRACFPEKVWLFRDLDGDSYYEGMKDAWVRVIPPNWETTKRRTEMLEAGIPDEFALKLMDIYLCYGGTNLEVDVAKRDKNGRVVWGEGGVVIDYLTFDEAGQMSFQEFADTLAKIPSAVVDHWHARTLEIVPEWRIS
jgi:hypothetical protein